jgi:hypothetical protein
MEDRKSMFPSFPSCTWERKCPRNFVASAWEKHSFADKGVPKYNLGTREIPF